MTGIYSIFKVFHLSTLVFSVVLVVSSVKNELPPPFLNNPLAALRWEATAASLM